MTPFLRSTRRTIAVDSGPYDGLTHVSQLARNFRAAQRAPSAARINIVLPSFLPAARYAGINTATQVACDLAALTSRAVRVITIDPMTAVQLAEASAEIQRRTGQLDSTAVSLASGGVSCHEHDLWIVTYWTTAHLLSLASRRLDIDPHRVVYLIQDYEPSFFGWSTASAIAEQTYRAGFIPMVNSEPLRRYLETKSVPVDADCAFAPTIDYPKLAETAAARKLWDGRSAIRVFFYARPAKPRNLYEIGACVLKILDSRPRSAGDPPIEVVCAGAEAPIIGLRNMKQHNVGKISYSAYYRLLADCHASLSLMWSPHPSHPPLESAISGGLSVTNRFGAYRDNLHPRLHLADADPDDLATALAGALQEIATATVVPPFIPMREDILGRPVKKVAARINELLARDD